MQTMDLNTSALPITNALLSMELLRRPAFLVILMTMRWLRTSTVPTKRAHPYPHMERCCRRGNRNLRVGDVVERVTASSEPGLPYADRGGDQVLGT